MGETGAGEPAGEGAGSLRGFGVSGRAMAISSVTVTNLNPLASSWSSVAGMASIVPGWMFNVASLVHGYEAMLAIGFIFTIHFFNAHLRMEKFPVDDVMFTGRLSEDEFKHERGAEYERLAASGELEKLRVAPAPKWYRPLAITAGLGAMAIGTTLVVLIILAGLEIIR